MTGRAPITQAAPFERETETVSRFAVAGSFVVFLMLIIGLWSSARSPFVLVVTSPFASEQSRLSLIAEAGGAFVGSGRTSWMTVAYSDAASFPARLRQAGALFVLNPGLAAICRQEPSP